MKAKHNFVMIRQISKLKNYKITEVSQIHMIAFWITLTLSCVLTIFYLLWAPGLYS